MPGPADAGDPALEQAKLAQLAPYACQGSRNAHPGGPDARTPVMSARAGNLLAISAGTLISLDTFFHKSNCQKIAIT
jgi:hypothetical protein